MIRSGVKEYYMTKLTMYVFPNAMSPLICEQGLLKLIPKIQTF